MKFETVEAAIGKISKTGTVFIHGAAATPSVLLHELMLQSERFQNLELVHLHTEGTASYAQSRFSKNFQVSSLFVGANLRASLNYANVDYLPCFLSEIPKLFRTRRKSIDVALLHVSPPDSHGYCSLGVSVDIARAATQMAGLVIAQVNPKMPRVHGDALIHSSQIHSWVGVDEPLVEHVSLPPNPAERRIGEITAALIEEGATLQVGVGTIPDAILAALVHHRYLGIHSETWSDGALRLIQSGAVDNSRKKVHAGKTVSGFITGSKDVYDFIHDNPSVVQFGVDYVNSPAIIARNPAVTAINSATEVDLTGQVCADSVGAKIISGVGGQLDFMRGAALSEKGKPIIALLSRTKQGKSRIVASLKPGAGVVTTRADVHYVVTEFGAVDLFGKRLGERARLLQSIAHPDDRESLARDWQSLTRHVL